ncbi:MAG: ABC transporter ATP-binding protein [Candidatus Cyclobacteriaceae bacterium M3_2C_046]
MEILATHHIHKSYAEHEALRDINISIPKGSIFGLLGPNGAGKTTLIRIINQIIAADKGQVLINGEELKSKHIRDIGYLPEERGLYKKMKVGEQLLYLAQLRGLSKSESFERIKKWFKKLEISGWWNKNVEDLSKGMQQKIQFIATVLHDPALIILDEPFSGFDPVNANLIKEKILELRDNGSTIIFSTHRMESVEELCDHIALIHKAEKILDGPQKQIKETFKANTYIVEHKNDFAQLNGSFELLEKKPLEDQFYRSVIKIHQENDPNGLLRELINQVEIHSFVEKIPNMNEIFIAKVQDEKTS